MIIFTTNLDQSHLSSDLPGPNRVTSIISYYVGKGEIFFGIVAMGVATVVIAVFRSKRRPEGNSSMLVGLMTALVAAGLFIFLSKSPRRRKEAAR